MRGTPGCDSLRSRVLDGAGLGAIRETEAAHLRECPACRSTLARLERGTAALAAELDRLAPSFDADEAVALAVSGRNAERQTRDTRSEVRSRSDGIRRVAWPLAAAAAAVLAAVWAGPWRPGGPGSPGAISPAALAPAGVDATDAPSGFSVEVPEATGVAVFATRDPRIHVVWFY